MDMEPVQRRILGMIEKAGTIHLRKLFKVVGIGIEDLLKVTKQLEEKGYIKSFSHGGYKFFSITEEGKRALKTKEERPQEVIGEEAS